MLSSDKPAGSLMCGWAGDAFGIALVGGRAGRQARRAAHVRGYKQAERLRRHWRGVACRGEAIASKRLARRSSRCHVMCAYVACARTRMAPKSGCGGLRRHRRQCRRSIARRLSSSRGARSLANQLFWLLSRHNNRRRASTCWRADADGGIGM